MSKDYFCIIKDEGYLYIVLLLKIYLYSGIQRAVCSIILHIGLLLSVFGKFSNHGIELLWMSVNVYFIFWLKLLFERDEREYEKSHSIFAATAFSQQQHPDTKSLKNQISFCDCVVNIVEWK